MRRLGGLRSAVDRRSGGIRSAAMLPQKITVVKVPGMRKNQVTRSLVVFYSWAFILIPSTAAIYNSADDIIMVMIHEYFF